MHVLADVKGLFHDVSVFIVGMLIIGTFILLLVFYKLFESDLFGPE